MKKLKSNRNGSLVDLWSLTHITWGVVLTIWLGPVWALILLVLWEPVEIFVLSPLLKKLFGIKFGYETLKNSLSDIFFDIVGVLLAVSIT